MVIYPVINFEVIAGGYYDIIKGEELNPDKIALGLEAISK
jgi:hypothetical protein